MMRHSGHEWKIEQKVSTGSRDGCKYAAPALWAAQRKYEEKLQGSEVRADEEMDVGV